VRFSGNVLRGRPLAALPRRFIGSPEVEPRHRSGSSLHWKRTWSTRVQRPQRCPLWVTCGRRLGKNFLTFLQHWSGAVTCPACWCGWYGRWP